MKTPLEIFKNNPDIIENEAVRELISEYETVCDALLDLQQESERYREVPLRVLVQEIMESIDMEMARDLEAERFGQIPRVDFKQAIINLRSYMRDYCRDHRIYFS